MEIPLLRTRLVRTRAWRQVKAAFISLHKRGWLNLVVTVFSQENNTFGEKFRGSSGRLIVDGNACTA
ncbi:hypothetical protein EXU57_03025 [Segetibacter sp. 3557_3]|uniref:hypothetical protein n=1 Tax=Segetibacter sp. 3557_3 TaxID=2547429 RepID=UPI0010591A81|nr:hypothetical protein [Segetibacter sp. 3557_3]TDH29059.1 hypothetical protein EXU57_03025 [Segetibacter sp. 3557_3]